jgi:hypothetical protein
MPYERGRVGNFGKHKKYQLLQRFVSQNEILKKKWGFFGNLK